MYALLERARADADITEFNSRRSDALHDPEPSQLSELVARAHQCLNRARAIFRAQGHEEPWVKTTLDLSAIFFHAHDLELDLFPGIDLVQYSRGLAEEALPAAEDRVAVFYLEAVWRVAVTYLEEEDWVHASQLLNDGIAFAEDRGNLDKAYTFLIDLGTVALNGLGDPAAALKALTRAMGFEPHVITTYKEEAARRTFINRTSDLHAAAAMSACLLGKFEEALTYDLKGRMRFRAAPLDQQGTTKGVPEKPFLGEGIPYITLIMTRHQGFWIGALQQNDQVKIVGRGIEAPVHRDLLDLVEGNEEASLAPWAAHYAQYINDPNGTGSQAWGTVIHKALAVLGHQLRGDLTAMLDALGESAPPRVTLSVSGALSMLPWQALRITSDEAAPALSFRVSDRVTRRETSPRPQGLGFVVDERLELGPHGARLSTYASTQGDHLPRGAAANKDAIGDLLQRCRVAVIFCHGRYEWYNPLDSGLELPAGDMIRARDILELPDLSGLDLVVLAACETALTDFEHTPGEELGLASALLSAGVGHVIAAAWPVSAQYTVSMLEGLLPMVRQGEAPDLALHHALSAPAAPSAGNDVTLFRRGVISPTNELSRCAFKCFAG